MNCTPVPMSTLQTPPTAQAGTDCAGKWENILQTSPTARNTQQQGIAYLDLFNFSESQISTFKSWSFSQLTLIKCFKSRKCFKLIELPSREPREQDSSNFVLSLNGFALLFCFVTEFLQFSKQKMHHSSRSHKQNERCRQKETLKKTSSSKKWKTFSWQCQPFKCPLYSDL